MIEQVLSLGTADRILTCGVTGNVFLLASGHDLGSEVNRFLGDRSLNEFIAPARKYLEEYPGKILMPVDLAYRKGGRREEMSVYSMPADELFLDIGEKTIAGYKGEIGSAGTVFVNGPAGMFEDPLFEKGTRELWKAFEEAPGYTVIGGGDSVSAAGKYTDMAKLGYVCTAGGAMVRFLSGKKLPLIEAMEKTGRKG